MARTLHHHPAQTQEKPSPDPENVIIPANSLKRLQGGLNYRQAKFVRVYSGNGVQAAREAGYKGGYGSLAAMASALLKSPKVLEALERRDKDALSVDVASRHKRLSFWYDTMLDKKQSMATRLRASELLGKACGDFIEKRLEVSLKADERQVKWQVSPIPNQLDVARTLDVMAGALGDRLGQMIDVKALESSEVAGEG